MKKNTKAAVDKAIENYRQSLISSATANAVKAHADGDVLAHQMLRIPVGKNVIQAEALVFGKTYKKLLTETGGTIIKGQRIDWLAEHVEETRGEVYEIIKKGLEEGKPVASIGGKHSVKGTVAHDLEKLAIRDRKFKYVRIARTETASIQNKAALSRFTKNRITHVDVVDGTDFDEACREANGQRWTVEYAQTHELEHPNCTRTFTPVITDDWEAESEEVLGPKKAKPSKLSKIKAPTSHKIKPEILSDLKGQNFAKVSELSRSVDPSKVFDALEKTGWKPGKVFTKGNIMSDDMIHLDMNGKIFGMSRSVVDGDILRVTQAELVPGVNPFFGNAIVNSNVETMKKLGLKRIEFIDNDNEAVNAIYKKFGLVKKDKAWASNVEWLEDNFDIIDSKKVMRPKFDSAKESKRIDAHLQTLEKSKMQDSITALDRYTMDDFTDVNSVLRNGINSPEAMKLPPARYREVLDRIDEITDFLDDAPKFDGVAYRGVSFKNKREMNDLIKNLQSHDKTSFPAFSSSSAKQDVIEDFLTESKYGVMLKFESSQGVYIKDFSHFKGEYEVLFNRNAKFKIKGIKKVSENYYEIGLEDVK